MALFPEVTVFAACTELFSAMCGLQEILIADLLDYMKYLDTGWEKKWGCFRVYNT